MRKISESTVRRLSVYLGLLEEFARLGKATVSSDEMAQRGHTTPAQVRKDLSFFGSFGKRGLGYDVVELSDRLRDILGLGRTYRVTVIGAGKIGSALVQYREFGERGFHIVSVYDNDEAKVGRSWNGVEVRDVRQLESDLRTEPVDIAILAIPPHVAQQTMDLLVGIGVKAVLNFAPIRLSHPDEVTVQNVNMALELETLSYALRNS
ncbi:MAG: redox-sensing transcriptional repressor Rex [Gemmatimonadota bacterium]|nr:MAG: redox-sensing transcriptional repressor Rex [Gemmatimonadota bacterium]